jgi:hypothetical protein
MLKQVVEAATTAFATTHTEEAVLRIQNTAHQPHSLETNTFFSFLSPLL